MQNKEIYPHQERKPRFKHELKEIFQDLQKDAIYRSEKISW